MPVLLTSGGEVASYAGVLVVAILAMGLAGGILLLSALVGPRRSHGAVKDEAYESGMPPVTEARRRFHIRFYVVAVLFLLLDVEVLLLWPWAPVFTRACRGGDGLLTLSNDAVAGAGFLLVSMVIFVVLLIVGLIYEWRRGVFQWD